MSTVIDCHYHLEERLLTVDQMIARMDAAGIGRVALMGAMTEPIPEMPRPLVRLLQLLLGHRATRPLGRRFVERFDAAGNVEILGKQSGWFKVKSTKGSGWVRMLSIRRGEARKGSGEDAGVLGLASGRAGTGKVVATTGIRGLSEEELKAAKYNENELKKAESFAVTEAEARRFAAEGKLVARKVKYLSAPEEAKGGR
jgi:hypothetical protein